MSEARHRERSAQRAEGERSHHDETRELHAFQDGELSPWRRWRIARRLSRDARARRELASIAELGALLREQADTLGEPDLWESIRARLPYAAKPAAMSTPLPEPVGWAPAWLGAALATAVVACVMATGWLPGDAPSVASVRWLDSKGKPVMVLRDDRKATIIWVIQKPKQTTEGARGAVA